MLDANFQSAVQPIRDQKPINEKLPTAGELEQRNKAIERAKSLQAEGNTKLAAAEWRKVVDLLEYEKSNGKLFANRIVARTSNSSKQEFA